MYIGLCDFLPNLLNLKRQAVAKKLVIWNQFGAKGHHGNRFSLGRKKNWGKEKKSEMILTRPGVFSPLGTGEYA